MEDRLSGQLTGRVANDNAGSMPMRDAHTGFSHVAQPAGRLHEEAFPALTNSPPAAAAAQTSTQTTSSLASPALFAQPLDTRAGRFTNPDALTTFGLEGMSAAGGLRPSQQSSGLPSGREIASRGEDSTSACMPLPGWPAFAGIEQSVQQQQRPRAPRPPIGSQPYMQPTSDVPSVPGSASLGPASLRLQPSSTSSTSRYSVPGSIHGSFQGGLDLDQVRSISSVRLHPAAAAVPLPSFMELPRGSAFSRSLQLSNNQGSQAPATEETGAPGPGASTMSGVGKSPAAHMTNPTFSMRAGSDLQSTMHFPYWQQQQLAGLAQPQGTGADLKTLPQEQSGRPSDIPQPSQSQSRVPAGLSPPPVTLLPQAVRSQSSGLAWTQQPQAWGDQDPLPVPQAHRSSLLQHPAPRHTR